MYDAFGGCDETVAVTRTSNVLGKICCFRYLNLCCNNLSKHQCGVALSIVNELCNNRCVVLNYYDLGLLRSCFEILRGFS